MKKAVFVLILMAFYINPFCQTGKISGVITFYFNEFQGDKPDIGSKVYLIDSAKNSFFNINSWDSLNQATICASTYSTTKDLVPEYYKDMKRLEKKSEKWQKQYLYYKDLYESTKRATDQSLYYLTMTNLLTEQSRKELDNRVATMFIKLEISNQPTRIVDGAGNYSFSNVQPGTYYVWIRSNNRKKAILSEALGKVYCTKVHVTIDEINVSNRFGL